MEVWVSGRNQHTANVPSCKASKVRILLPPLMELWQTWCMRRTENPENVVQLHEVPQEYNEVFSSGNESRL